MTNSKKKQNKKKSQDFNHNNHQHKKQESSAKLENYHHENNNVEKSPLKKQLSKKIDTINIIQEPEKIDIEQTKQDQDTCEKENQISNSEKHKKKQKNKKPKDIDVKKPQHENIDVKKPQHENIDVEKPKHENIDVDKPEQIYDLIKNQDQNKTVKFTWDDINQDVQLTGNWLNWTDRINLTYKDGKLECNLELPKGIYYFKFIVNGQWLVNHNYQTEMDGGNQNNKIIID